MNEKESNKEFDKINKGNDEEEEFSRKLVRILLGGSFLYFILRVIYGLIVGNFQLSIIPAVIVKSGIYFCMLLLTIPRFEKHKLWILVWATILCFLLIFTCA